MLLPAFVYPIRLITGILLFCLLERYCDLCRLTLSKSDFNLCIRFVINRLSVSSCVSPGPLVPIPPPRRSKWDHCPANLGRRYWCWANSTCNLPSRVFALDAKRSRISAVRSITLVSSPKYRSILRCWAGVNSSSNITVSYLPWRFFNSSNLWCDRTDLLTKARIFVPQARLRIVHTPYAYDKKTPNSAQGLDF